MAKKAMRACRRGWKWTASIVSVCSLTVLGYMPAATAAGGGGSVPSAAPGVASLGPVGNGSSIQAPTPSGFGMGQGGPPLSDHAPLSPAPGSAKFPPPVLSPLAQAQANALAQAKALGHGVKVAGSTTGTSQTMANPDGSFTTDISSGPARVHTVASQFRWKIGEGRRFLVAMLGGGCDGLVDLTAGISGGGWVEQLVA